MKIGLLVGRENTFPQAFIDYINALALPDITAEFCKLGGTRMGEPPEYRVIVDRISHEVPYYRAYLKNAVLQGAVVINDPFWWSTDDKYFECCLSEKLGVAVPRTMVLPNKDYIPEITAESLRNLVAPLDWQAMLDYTGLPAILKPAIGGGWKNVSKVHNVEELVRAFDAGGQLLMILQEFIDFQQYVRCICLGKHNIKVIPYNPLVPFAERYAPDPHYLAPALHERVVHDARTLCDALGYDMNTVEFAIRDGVPYAIDFLNPAPDFDSFSIKEENFQWVLENLSRLVIAYARGEASPWSPPGTSVPGHDYRWSHTLRGGETAAGVLGAAVAEVGHTAVRAAEAVGAALKRGGHKKGTHDPGATPSPRAGEKAAKNTARRKKGDQAEDTVVG